MYTAQHSTAQHSTAQHSTAQHSTAQHSTAQPYLALDNYCCNSLFKQSFGCTQPYFFRDKGSVLANEVLCLFRHCEQSKTAWQSTKILPLIRGDVSQRLTERFSEQSEIDFQYYSDSCARYKSYFPYFLTLASNCQKRINRLKVFSKKSSFKATGSRYKQNSKTINNQFFWRNSYVSI